MKIKERKQYQNQINNIFQKANIVLTKEEQDTIEIADFGLNDFLTTGLSLITYVNTKHVCAKELVLLPHQTCPEHYHPDKEETFRCRKGIVYLYVSGEKTSPIQATVPGEYYTVFHEIVLHPGEQYTLHPKTWHWFQAGDEKTIVSEFSTTSTDEEDLFRDPNIIRIPETEEE